MPDTPPRRTILAVDDHELVRVGLRQVIAQHFGDRFEFADAHSLEQALLHLQHGADRVFLLLLDLNLGDTRGLAGLRLLRQRYPDLPIVVVSGTQDALVRDEALAHGAWAYFSKTGDTNDLSGLLDTIGAAAAGPRVARGAAGTEPGPADALARYRHLKPDVRLTGRQIQVLELILSGLDNQAIAAETGLALGSVKNCVSTVFLTFNVRSRAELIGLFS
ncbi:MAG: response regulator transcription factor [Hydrogenophaga sp.]|nr:response regulator transcription factor [Hydrogenophaga sp.]